MPVKDPFYRYQMPPPRGHKEKTWTIIPSFVLTTNALHRQQEEVLKYLSLSLHTPTKLDQGRACIKGHFSDEEVLSVLRQYIEDFVLCSGCKKPETAYRIRNSGTIVQKCFACGKKSPLNMCHKLCGFIRLQYKSRKAVRVSMQQKHDMTIPISLDCGERFSKSTTLVLNGKTLKEKKLKSTVVSQSISDEEAMDQAVCGLQKAMKSGMNSISASQLARLVSREQRASMLSSRDRVRILIRAAELKSTTTNNQFDEIVYETLAKIVADSSVMRAFMEEYVILCFEEATASSVHKRSGLVFVSHLKACYEEDVLTEESIIAWWSGVGLRSEPLVEPSLRQRLRRVSTPLIKWLELDEQCSTSDCSEEI